MQTYSGPKRRLDSLEIGRGLAALAVVLYHANANLGEMPPGELHWTLRGGSKGVEFFFVLSGFLMMYLYRSKFGEEQIAKTFLLQRVERIYPLYWIITLPLLALSLTGIARAVEDGQILTSLTLLPAVVQPRLTVAWTLVFEMYFYFLFAIALAWPRLGIMLGGAVAVGALASIPFGPFIWPLKFLISPIILLFAMGMLSALAVPYVGRYGLSLAIAGSVIFGTATIGLAGDDIPLEAAGMLCGIGAAIAIAGMVARDNSSRSYAKPLVALGGASYALYLIHYPVISITGRLINASGLDLPNWAVIGMFLAASLIAGFTVHYAIEKPVARWLKSRDPGGTPVPSHGSAA